VSLSIEPDTEVFIAPKGWKKSKNHILSAETVILDLNKSEDELLSGMAKKTRQYIRKSGNSGIVIKNVKSEKELQECLDIYHQTSERAGFGLHSDQYYKDIFAAMGEYSPVLVSYVKDQPVAFLWMAISADVAYELYGGMNDVGKDLRANYALKWAMICKCKEWGLSRYDFGGMVEGGVSTFKKGWTESESVLAGTFDYPLSFFYGLYSNILPFGKKLVRRCKKLLKH
jgi:lipid II:glycine glycyltransferase (peptidoglycan interpeptide bridge formation enzyme)